MDKETLKNYLIRDKVFLRQLYEGQDKFKNNKILNFASDSKLNTLIKFLHFLCNGEIKIKRENFDILQVNFSNIFEQFFNMFFCKISFFAN